MHVVTGELRDEPFVKEGDGWTMFSVRLSEYIKTKEGAEYSNYRATFFAKTDHERAMYEGALKKGKVISVASEKLLVTKKDDYINLEMQYPRLVFFQRDTVPF